MKRATWQQHLPLCALVAVIAILTAGVKFLPEDSPLGENARLLWIIVPSALAVWQYSYARVRSHRLLVQRIRMMVINPECAWSMTAEYDTHVTRQSAAAALNHLGPNQAEEVKVLSKAHDRIVYQTASITVVAAWESTTDEFDEANVVIIDIPETRHTYRRWRSVIDGAIPVLLERVDRDLRPTRRKYAARIRFGASNPYFGLFVTDYSVSDVSRFQLEQTVKWQGCTVAVTVSKEEIRLVSDSYEAIRALSLRYLAVREVGG